MAINAPIQGSDSDIMKVAMIQIYKEFGQEFQAGEIQLLLQVHDELLFEVPLKRVAMLRTRVRQIMEQACHLAVPLRVDVKEGKNWRDMA